MKILRLSLLLMITGLLGLSCTRGPVFEEMKLLPNDNWLRFNTLWYNYMPKEHEDTCTISLVVRYNDAIPFDVLQVMGTIHAPSGEMRFREYSIPLRDANGLPDGEVIKEDTEKGKTYEKRVILRDGFVFSEEGNYRFEIENLMGKYDNPGIVAVGVVVDRE